MELKSIREEIDNIDEQIVALFKRRMDLSVKVAESKIKTGSPVLNAEREEEVLSNIERLGGEYGHYARLLYGNVMEEVRDALDALAVVCACKRMTDTQFVELKEAMKAFEEATRTDDVRRIVETDEAFHDVIYAAAANPKLENIINSAREQMYRYRYEYVKNPTVYAQLISEHKQIIDGFDKRDVDYLKEIMHIHLANQINAVREVIREQK